MKKIILNGLNLALVLGLTACGGGSSNTNFTDDTTAPVITINGGDALIIKGTNYIDAGATATDDTDASVEVITSSNVNTALEGTYKINYSATDTAGNSAIIKTRTVTVTRQEDFAKFDGIWESACEKTTKPELNALGVNYIFKRLKIYKPQGIDIRYKGYADNSTNCTGATIYTGKLFGTVTYLGQVSTSTCQGEKIDISLGYGHVDNGPIGSSDQTKLHNFARLVDFPLYNILCKNGNILYDGKLTEAHNGSSDESRPIEFNTNGFTLMP